MYNFFVLLFVCYWILDALPTGAKSLDFKIQPVQPAQAPIWQSQPVQPAQAPIWQSQPVQPAQAPIWQSQPVQPAQAPIWQSQPVQPAQAPIWQSQPVQPAQAPIWQSQPVQPAQAPIWQSQPVQPAQAPIWQSQPVQPAQAPIWQSQPVQPAQAPIWQSQPVQPAQAPIWQSQPVQPAQAPIWQSQPVQPAQAPIWQSQPVQPAQAPIWQSQPVQPAQAPIWQSQPGSPYKGESSQLPAESQLGPDIDIQARYAQGQGQKKDDTMLREPRIKNRYGGHETFTKDEMRQEIERFFGEYSLALAQILDKIFKDHGQPTGYIMGEESTGAVIVGFRYGEGDLWFKNGMTRHIYWQSPTIGLDLGGNGGKVFTLLFNLTDPQMLFQRFLGMDGSIYVVEGYSVNYQQNLDVFLAPIRSGHGLRVGVSVGYMHYTDTKTYNPF
ncbi:conserved hypothetical protein [Desulfovibrionales bacterium]